MKTELQIAYASRAAAHKALDASTAALERARNLANAAAERLRKAEASTADSEARRAVELADAIVAGGGEVESVWPIDEMVCDEVMRSARQDAKLKAQALAKLESAHDAAKSNLAAAQAAVVNAVDSLLAAEMPWRLAEFERAVDALMPLASMIEIPSGIDRPVNFVSPLSAIAEKVLDALKSPPDPLNTPLGALPQLGARNDWIGGRDALAERRAALIAGEQSPEEQAARRLALCDPK